MPLGTQHSALSTQYLGREVAVNELHGIIPIVYTPFDADGRIILDDVRRLVVPCLAHRMLPVGASAATARAHEETSAILEGIVTATAVPV